MNSRLLAAGLLCLNVVLACLALQPRAVAPATRTTGAPTTSQAPRTLTRTEEVIKPGEVVQLDWHAVEAEDFKEYIAHLKAIQCPQQTIRDIIIADVNKLYAAKWRALVNPDGTVKYWQFWDPNAPENKELMAQQKNLDTEKRSLIRELLGVDLDQESRKLDLHWTWLDREDAMMEFLPPEKRAKIQVLRQESRDATQAIMDRTGGKLTEADRKELARIRAKEQADMHAVMSPEEFNQYVMRVSATANTVRAGLLGFDPSQEEYEAVFWAQSSFNNKFKNYTGDPGSPEYQQNRAAAQKEMDDQVRAKLGDERYADYQRTKDGDYRELYRFAQQAGLPKEAASQSYTIKLQAEQQAARIRTDASLSAEQKSAALQGILTETKKALGQVMGGNYNTYEQSRAYWMRAFNQ